MSKTIRYFFDPPLIRASELCVRGIGIREVMRPGIVDRPGGTGDILAMFFYDETIIRSASGDRLYPPDSLMIWPRTAGHYYGNPGKAWNHSWLHCDGTAMADLLAREQIPVGAVIPCMSGAVVESYLMSLYLELTTGKPADTVIARNIVHNWFREIRRAMRPQEDRIAIPPRLQEVRWHMETHFTEPLTLSLLAQRACLSIPHFSAEFKRCFGVSPIDWLIRRRMGHAAFLLRDHNLRIGEVADRTGCPDHYYFSRLFKKRFGVSPRAYRRTIGAP